MQIGARRLRTAARFRRLARAAGAGHLEETTFTGGRRGQRIPGAATSADEAQAQVGNSQWSGPRAQGDYNNNGIVGISDLSPIACHGQSSRRQRPIMRHD